MVVSSGFSVINLIFFTFLPVIYLALSSVLLLSFLTSVYNCYFGMTRLFVVKIMFLLNKKETQISERRKIVFTDKMTLLTLAFPGRDSIHFDGFATLDQCRDDHHPHVVGS